MKTFIPSNAAIIAHIMKYGGNCDEAITALQSEEVQLTKSEEEVLVQKCLSSDKSVAQEGRAEYNERENKSKAILKSMARNDLEQSKRPSTP